MLSVMLSFVMMSFILLSVLVVFLVDCGSTECSGCHLDCHSAVFWVSFCWVSFLLSVLSVTLLNVISAECFRRHYVLCCSDECSDCYLECHFALFWVSFCWGLFWWVFWLSLCWVSFYLIFWVSFRVSFCTVLGVILLSLVLLSVLVIN